VNARFTLLRKRSEPQHLRIDPSRP
jgi:hypothetical protein